MAIATHSYKAGDKVPVINTTPSGRFILEGYADVLSRCSSGEHRYLVVFDSEPENPYERFVDPKTKEMNDTQIKEYIHGLNTTLQEIDPVKAFVDTMGGDYGVIQEVWETVLDQRVSESKLTNDEEQELRKRLEVRIYLDGEHVF